MDGESSAHRTRRKAKPALLQKAGRASIAAIRQALKGALVWALLGLCLGVVCDMACFVLSKLDFARGEMQLGDTWILAVAALVPVIGAGLFAIYGAEKGVAVAAIETEDEFGLIRYAVDESMALAEERFGSSIGDVPSESVERALAEGARHALGEVDDAWRGPLGWFAGRVLRALSSRYVDMLVAAYAEERTAAGPKGTVQVARLADRAHRNVVEGVEALVAWVLQKELVLLVVGFLILGIAWYPIVWKLRAYVPSFVS